VLQNRTDHVLATVAKELPLTDWSEKPIF